MSRVDDIASRLEALRQYWDERGVQPPGWSLEADADYLLARVRTLESALTEYGRHQRTCSGPGHHQETCNDCECGWEVLRQEVEPARAVLDGGQR